jgi:hypothetical protein
MVYISDKDIHETRWRGGLVPSVSIHNNSLHIVTDYGLDLGCWPCPQPGMVS